MLENFDPRYQLPLRKHFSKTTIPALFNSTQSALGEFFPVLQISGLLSCRPQLSSRDFKDSARAQTTFANIYYATSSLYL